MQSRLSETNTGGSRLIQMDNPKSWTNQSPVVPLFFSNCGHILWPEKATFFSAQAQIALPQDSKFSLGGGGT